MIGGWHNLWLGLLFLEFCCLSYHVDALPGESHGTEFTIMFLENIGGQDPTLELQAVSSNSDNFTMSVTYYNETLESANTIQTSYSLMHTVTAADHLMRSGSYSQKTGVFVQASKEISLYGMNRQQSTSDGFLALPNRLLGNEYYISALNSSSTVSQIGVVALYENTSLVIDLNPEARGAISGVFPGSGPFRRTISRLEAIQLQCHVTASSCNFAGSFIRANKPIAVFTGSKSLVSYQVEQIPPLHTLGKHFTLVGSDHPSGDLVQVVAINDGTEVVYYAPGESTTPRRLIRGETLHLSLMPLKVVRIVSNSYPIIVTQHIKSTGGPGQSMLVIPPDNQRLTASQNLNFWLSTPITGSFDTHFLMIIADAVDVSKLRLDNSPISELWDTRDGVSGAVVALSAGRHYITATSTVRFSALVHGRESSGGSCYGYPIGMRLDTLNPCSSVSMVSTSPDGKDNDCDFFIDEEICDDGIDNDSDQRVDEDCGSWISQTGISHSHNRAVGHEFMVMFLENRGSDLPPGQSLPNNEIFITSAQTQSLIVRVFSPGLSLNFSRSVPGSSVARIDISSNVRMSGTSRGNNAILITSDNDATVYAINKNVFSVDGFLALPTDMLGNEYYVVCYSKPQIATEFGIAGVVDGTYLSITFPPRTIKVVLDGVTYGSGSTLQTSLDRFGTLQIQCEELCDLTGTYIQSTKPVAVFSGNIRSSIPPSSRTRDHLVEQMIPIHTWGYEFPIVGTSASDGDVIVVLAQRDATTVTVYNGGPPITVTLNRGEAREWQINPSSLSFVRSTEPVLVTQFLKSQSAGMMPVDPSMIIVPAADQYSHQYRFSTTEGVATNYTNYLMITVKDIHTSGIIIDGAVRTFSNWYRSGGTSYVGISVVIESGTHTVTHTNPDANIGLVLYGAGDRESYAFPIGMNLLPINPCSPSPMVVADGIDNDCDQYIDEEVCDDFIDNDGDGQMDEDCISVLPTTTRTSPTTPSTTTTSTSTTTTTPTTTTPAPQPREKEVYDVYHCGTDTLRLSCVMSEGSRLIQIVQAHYGRISYPNEMTCGQANLQNLWEDKFVDRLCGYVNHYDSVASECDRDSTCILDPQYYREISGVNACPACSLYLHVTYRCIDPIDYQFNDLKFGTQQASSVLDNALSSSWRSPDDCAHLPYHSHESCETACSTLLLQTSKLCPGHADRCSLVGGDFGATNIQAWCPDETEAGVSFVDTFLGETYKVTGLIIQGGRRYQGWISRMSLWYSMDNINWSRAHTAQMSVDGNTDAVSVVLVKFVAPVIARWMGIQVEEYVNLPYAHVAYIHHHEIERCPRISIRNSNIVNVAGSYGDQVVVECTSPHTAEGFVSEYTITCNDRLQWEGIKQCDSLTCGPLPDAADQVVGRDEIFVIRVGGSYDCPPGNTSLGYELLYCNEDTWTWQWRGQCCDGCLRSYDAVGIPDTCYRYPLSINAGISSDPVTRLAEETLTYQCAEGMELVSPGSQSVCQESSSDFVWDVDIIKCSNGVVVELEALPAVSPISAFLSEAVVITDLSATIAVGIRGFDTIDANVVCREINGDYRFTGLAMAMNRSDSLANHVIKRHDLDCVGDEGSINDCDYFVTDDYISYAYAGVVCHDVSGCVNGEVRILDHDGDGHGLVQYCHQNTWGAVSGLYYGWGDNEATVVCRQLGFDLQSSLKPGDADTAIHIEDIGPGWLHNVECTGAESRLIDCSFGTSETPNIIGAGFFLHDDGDSSAAAYTYNFRDILAYAACSA